MRGEARAGAVSRSATGTYVQPASRIVWTIGSFISATSKR